MKKICGLFLFCLALLPAYAQDSVNSIEMVTFFPVPYTSYQKLDVLGRCDVGLLHACSMEGGVMLNEAIDPLDNKQVPGLNTGNLRVSSGRLNLDAASDANGGGTTQLFIDNSLWVGKTSNTKGSLTFSHALQITNFLPTKMALASTDTTTVTSLTLGGAGQLPTCSGSKKLTWRELTIDGTTGVFLICIAE